jgi:hypothetical protein
MVLLVDAARDKPVWSVWPVDGGETGRLRNPCGASPIRECRQECAGSAAAMERGLCAMPAGRERIYDQSYKTALMASGARTWPSADGVLVSTDSNQSGLWLWQGEAPPQPSLPRPKLGNGQVLRRIIPAGGWAGWITLPAGLAIALFAVSMMPHSDSPVSVGAPAVAPSSAPSPAVAPPGVIVPPAEPTAAQLDPVPAPSTSTAKIPVQTVKSGAQRKSSRTVKSTHASHVRRGSPVPMPGVLTPPLT